MTEPKFTPPRDTKMELLEAARNALRKEAEKARERQYIPPAAGSHVGLGSIALLGLLGLVILLARPAWLVGPDRPPAEPPAVAAASLRLSLLRERERVLDFAARRGRLPRTLAEAGVTTEGITFRPMSESAFELSASTGDSVVTLGSQDSMSAFLGGSLRAILQRGKP